MTSTTGWTVVCREESNDKKKLVLTSRLEVPGGWLYRTIRRELYDYNKGLAANVALVFVPNELAVIQPDKEPVR